VRGAGPNLRRLIEARLGNAVALDWTVDLGAMLPLVPAATATQGNVDPLALVAGGAALDEAVDAILAAIRGRPHVFNLGHGILPETPIAHVERMVARVRAG
jgi:uroporphyrinogen decarboxylase